MNQSNFSMHNEYYAILLKVLLNLSKNKINLKHFNLPKYNKTQKFYYFIIILLK